MPAVILFNIIEYYNKGNEIKWV